MSSDSHSYIPLVTPSSSPNLTPTSTPSSQNCQGRNGQNHNASYDYECQGQSGSGLGLGSAGTSTSNSRSNIFRVNGRKHSSSPSRMRGYGHGQGHQTSLRTTIYIVCACATVLLVLVVNYNLNILKNIKRNRDELKVVNEVSRQGLYSNRDIKVDVIAGKSGVKSAADARNGDGKSYSLSFDLKMDLERLRSQKKSKIDDRKAVKRMDFGMDEAHEMREGGALNLGKSNVDSSQRDDKPEGDFGLENDEGDEREIDGEVRDDFEVGRGDEIVMNDDDDSESLDDQQKGKTQGVEVVNDISPNSMLLASSSGDWLSIIKRVELASFDTVPKSGVIGKPNGLIVAIKDTCCWFYFKRKHAYTKQGFEMVTKKYDSLSLVNEQQSKSLAFIRKQDVVVCLTRFECWNEHMYSVVANQVGVNRILYSREVWSTKTGFCNTVRSSGLSKEWIDKFTFYCFVLPTHYTELMEDANLVTASHGDKKYIIKPQAAQGGKDIFVRDNTNINELANDNEYVVQPYLMRPMLIDGRKFDMRIHVIVTNVLPIRAYLHPLAFARFAASQYTDEKNGGKRSSFLTNISVNNKLIPTDQLTWQFVQFFEYISKELGLNAAKIYHDIQKSIAQLLLASENQFRQKYAAKKLKGKLAQNFKCKRCYQTLGMDVILDSSEKPYIIEVNGNPTLDFTADKLNLDATKFQNEMVKLMYNYDSVSDSVAARILLNKDSTNENEVYFNNEEIEYLIGLEKEQQNIQNKRLQFNQLYPPVIFDESEEQEWSDLINNLKYSGSKDDRSRRIRFHDILVQQEKTKIKTCINQFGLDKCGLDVQNGCKVFPNGEQCTSY